MHIYKYLVIIQHYRFGLMEKCWAEVAEDRPQFSFIEDKIRALLQQKEVESNVKFLGFVFK